jgi:hypothetical protein
MESLGINSREQKIEYLSSIILVKEDKTHSCYHFLEILENLA